MAQPECMFSQPPDKIVGLALTALGLAPERSRLPAANGGDAFSRGEAA
jgi:hypothetical protein